MGTAFKGGTLCHGPGSARVQKVDKSGFWAGPANVSVLLTSCGSRSVNGGLCVVNVEGTANSGHLDNGRASGCLQQRLNGFRQRTVEYFVNGILVG